MERHRPVGVHFGELVLRRVPAGQPGRRGRPPPTPGRSGTGCARSDRTRTSRARRSCAWVGYPAAGRSLLSAGQEDACPLARHAGQPATRTTTTARATTTAMPTATISHSCFIGSPLLAGPRSDRPARQCPRRAGRGHCVRRWGFRRRVGACSRAPLAAVQLGGSTNGRCQGGTNAMPGPGFGIENFPVSRPPAETGHRLQVAVRGRTQWVTGPTFWRVKRATHDPSQPITARPTRPCRSPRAR